MNIDRLAKDLQMAEEATRTAKSYEARARRDLIYGLAIQAGLKVGDKIRSTEGWRKGETRGFIDSFGLRRLPDSLGGGLEYQLTIYWVKARKDGTPYAKRERYALSQWERGWDDQKVNVTDQTVGTDTTWAETRG